MATWSGLWFAHFVQFDRICLSLSCLCHDLEATATAFGSRGSGPYRALDLRSGGSGPWRRNDGEGSSDEET